MTGSDYPSLVAGQRAYFWTDADLMDVDSVHDYEKGSWGPSAGDHLMAGHGRWHRPWIAS